MPFVERVVGLCAELRGSGVPVSVAETQDAVKAMMEIPVENRRALRSALAATLVKDPWSRKTFDRLFDVFFPVLRDAGPTQPSELPEELDVRDRLQRAIEETDMDEMRAIAERLVEDEADVQPGAQVSDEHYRYRALRHIDIEDLLRRIVDEEVEGKGLTALQRKLVEEDFEDRMERFGEEVADEIRARRRQGRSIDEQSNDERRQRPDEVDFLWARDSDVDAMRAALQPLGRRLALKLSNKRRRSRRGRLDVRRTIRSSLSTGGVMIEPRFRRPSAGKPELWVVCDISGSMRAFARFTLELSYAISTQFQRVRSFVFIDSMDEITGLLDAASDLKTVLERIDGQADVVHFDGQSWYGNSLAELWRGYGRQLSPRTCVLVVGDARNNMRTTGAEFLAEIRRNSRRVWWLNPEPRTYWDSADSVASSFEPHTHGMYECRNLRQLERFVVDAM